MPPCPGGSPPQRKHACSRSLCPSTSPNITICSTASYGFHGCDEMHAQLNCRVCTVQVNFRFHFHCVRPSHVISRHATSHSSCCKSVSRKSSRNSSSLCLRCPETYFVMGCCDSTLTFWRFSANAALPSSADQLHAEIPMPSAAKAFATICERYKGKCSGQLSQLAQR